MPDSLEYRQYLEEKFSHLVTLIKTNHKESMDSNDRIQARVDKTNGKVLELEKKVIVLEIADVTPLQLSLAATVSAFQYVNVGIGYNLADKHAFVLTGVQYNFNK